MSPANEIQPEVQIGGELERPLSVSQLTRRIKALLESGIGAARVEGEISNFKLSPAGHAYFSLKDEEAQIACVMFRREFARLDFEPANGKQVVLAGRVTVYEQRGQYQLIVETMAEQGLGALYQKFHALKAQLEKEGLFDESRKKPLPFLPRRIGVVTSITGAALRDIIHVLGRRFANLELFVYDARVQGEQAPRELSRGIRRFNELKQSGHPRIDVDVLIVGRGGGSLEDLWSFNDEGVARAIAASAIPVISAVGHQTDFTIADFVADLRAPTPSAAAEIVSQNQAELLERIAALQNRLRALTFNLIADRRERVATLLNSYGMRRPADRARELQQRVDDALHRGRQALCARLESARGRLAQLNGRLAALNPAAVLERGFSIVYRIAPATAARGGGASARKSAEEIVRSKTQVRPNDALRIQTADGDFPATVRPARNSAQLDIFEGG